MLDVSPFSRLKGLFYKEESRLRYLSEEEEISLLNVCQGMLKNIVLVALHTGMRLGEILNLKWSDIEWKKNEEPRKKRSADVHTG